jgi:plastocyanin
MNTLLTTPRAPIAIKLWAAVFVFATSIATAGTLSVQVIDKAGKPLPDAVVTLLPSNKNSKPQIPLPMQATIAQEKMQFLPAVSLVAVGAKINFTNNDSWNHHVRGYSADATQVDVAKSSGFALLLEGKSDGKKPASKEVTMEKAGVLGATLLGCFIHSSMRGYIFVSDSPWAAKTNAEGVAVFPDAPAGPAQLKVWQADQLIEPAPAPLEIANGNTRHVIQLQVTARRARAASTNTSPSTSNAY